MTGLTLRLELRRSRLVAFWLAVIILAYGGIIAAMFPILEENSKLLEDYLNILPEGAAGRLRDVGQPHRPRGLLQHLHRQLPVAGRRGHGGDHPRHTPGRGRRRAGLDGGRARHAPHADPQPAGRDRRAVPRARRAGGGGTGRRPHRRRARRGRLRHRPVPRRIGRLLAVRVRDRGRHLARRRAHPQPRHRRRGGGRRAPRHVPHEHRGRASGRPVVARLLSGGSST